MLYKTNEEIVEIKQQIVEALQINPSALNVTTDYHSGETFFVSWLDSYNIFSLYTRNKRKYKHIKSAIKAFNRDLRPIYDIGITLAKIVTLTEKIYFCQVKKEGCWVAKDKHFQKLKDNILFLFAEDPKTWSSYYLKSKLNSPAMQNTVNDICVDFVKKYTRCPLCGKKPLRFDKESNIVCNKCNSKVDIINKMWILTDDMCKKIQGEQNE